MDTILEAIETLSDKITLTQKEVFARGIELQAIGENVTKNDYFRNAAAKMNMNTEQLTQFLWDKYEPSSFWLVVTGIGIAASTILFLYDMFIIKKN